MTQHPTRNDGVIIGGNATVTGPVAAGRHAQAHQNTTGVDDELSEALADLHVLIRRHRARFTEPDLIDADLAELEREAAKPQPRRDRQQFTAVLDRIIQRSAGIASVLALAAQVRQIAG